MSPACMVVIGKREVPLLCVDAELRRKVKKKKNFALRTGPLTLPPYSFQCSTLFGFGAGLEMLLALNAVFWSYSNTSPCQLFVPLLVRTLIAARPLPYCAGALPELMLTSPIESSGI